MKLRSNAGIMVLTYDKTIILKHNWNWVVDCEGSTWYWASLEAERLDGYREASLLYREGGWRIK
jgi:hypothetical protein